MKKLPMLAVCALLSGVAGFAHACEELVALDRAQSTDLLNTLRDTAADPLDQYFAFETLMCSDQPGVRDLSLRTAARSENETVKSQVLLRAVMELESIPVRLLEQEGLEKAQYDRIKARPMEMMPVSFRDVTKSCLSFSNSRGCDPNNVLSVNGTLVTMRTRFNGHGIDGVFELEGGALVGQFSYTQEGLTYPARIDLF